MLQFARGTALSPMNPASHADPHRWKTLSRLYREALERDASERDAFLERACAGDHELRREVDWLLAHGDVIAVLDGGTGASATAVGEPGSFANGLIGSDLNGYRITSLVGIGGMGVVFKAVDSKFGRPVAIKLLWNAVANASVRRRFGARGADRLVAESPAYPDGARVGGGGTAGSISSRNSSTAGTLRAWVKGGAAHVAASRLTC